MGKNQLITIVIAIAAIASIFIFGSTKYPQQLIAKQQQQPNAQKLTPESLLKTALNATTAVEQKQWQKLENDLKAANTTIEKSNVLQEMALFSQNELKSEELTAYYYAKKVKLENSQKNLTFAANFILANCINAGIASPQRSFRAEIAKSLFEQALLQQPNNDSLKIGLAGCYMHGAYNDNPMIGTTTLLDMVKKDSTNALAQKMLGYGGLESGQYDNALKRFITSYKLNPADTTLAINIALNSKQMKKEVLSAEWFAKVKNLLKKDTAQWQLFEEEYKKIK